ncbi:SPOR domain-containing protein [Castellaniella defragrans]|uniref:SPOR domain-containing protein n=1 Tax=Castellaniella defragrans TaxID=75697 RepID=UPI002AFE800D|nr:SPOR domain-containing protein [Castellaniella defragrans]
MPRRPIIRPARPPPPASESPPTRRRPPARRSRRRPPPRPSRLPRRSRPRPSPRRRAKNPPSPSGPPTSPPRNARRPAAPTTARSPWPCWPARRRPRPGPRASPPRGGRYYLQVAAYTTEQDAQARRDSLRQAGVTDAYVERGQSNGRTVYRLRVGPFGSHEAAQAAQARLRALGYQNGLISGK